MKDRKIFVLKLFSNHSPKKSWHYYMANITCSCGKSENCNIFTSQNAISNLQSVSSNKIKILYKYFKVIHNRNHDIIRFRQKEAGRGPKSFQSISSNTFRCVLHIIMDLTGSHLRDIKAEKQRERIIKQHSYRKNSDNTVLHLNSVFPSRPNYSNKLPLTLK